MIQRYTSSARATAAMERKRLSVSRLRLAMTGCTTRLSLGGRLPACMAKLESLSNSNEDGTLAIARYSVSLYGKTIFCQQQRNAQEAVYGTLAPLC